MQADIAIVVIAYNRVAALERLFSSLKNADYNSCFNISLIVSIDYSGKDDCLELANNFTWIHGEKKIINHSEKQGLKKHVMQCGDLCLNYDAVIILEDDLFVSPAFYDYAQQAYNHYRDSDKIAGIGLYSYRFNEIALYPFEPISDGFDNYFLQVPCSWGQMWTGRHWQLFKSYISNRQITVQDELLPEPVKLWNSETSWKKLAYEYLIFTNRYLIYPRISLTTNFGDVGQHFDNKVTVWQTPLLLFKKDFAFSDIDISNSVYDGFFELDTSLVNKLIHTKLDICIDLNGSKPLGNIKNPYMLSAKKCANPIKKFPLSLYPYENNVLLALDDDDLTEDYISLGNTNSFSNELNVDRRLADIKRTFFSNELLIETASSSLYQSKEFKAGKFLLKPLRFLRRVFGG